MLNCYFDEKGELCETEIDLTKHLKINIDILDPEIKKERIMSYNSQDQHL